MSGDVDIISIFKASVCFSSSDPHFPLLLHYLSAKLSAQQRPLAITRPS